MTRESNFELLRIVCILMIQFMHIVGMVHKHPDLSFLNIQVESFINVVCNVGPSCFILISGWYGIKRKADKFATLVLFSVIYSIVCACIMEPLGVNTSFLIPIWKILGYGNWFIGCYFVVYLMSPYLNNLIEKMSREQVRNLLILLITIFGLIPTLLYAHSGPVVYQGGKCIAWFTTVYLFGRYLRKYYDKTPSKVVVIQMISIPFVLMFIIRFVVSLLPPPLNDTHNYLERDYNPMILCSATGVFYAFKSIMLRSSLVNYLAGSCFAVYLLGWGGQYLSENIFQVTNNASNPFLFTLIILDGLVIFCIGVIIDKSIRSIFGKFIHFLVLYIIVIYRKIVLTLKPIVNKL